MNVQTDVKWGLFNKQNVVGELSPKAQSSGNTASKHDSQARLYDQVMQTKQVLNIDWPQHVLLGNLDPDIHADAT